MARPKKPPEIKLTALVKVRLTADQLAKVDAITTKYGMSRSGFLRELVDHGEVKIHNLPETNREAITLLRKTGGLLAALLKKFPTEAKDLQTLRREAHRLAAHFAGFEER